LHVELSTALRFFATNDSKDRPDWRLPRSRNLKQIFGPGLEPLRMFQPQAGGRHVLHDDGESPIDAIVDHRADVRPEGSANPLSDTPIRLRQTAAVRFRSPGRNALTHLKGTYAHGYASFSAKKARKLRVESAGPIRSRCVGGTVVCRATRPPLLVSPNGGK